MRKPNSLWRNVVVFITHLKNASVRMNGAVNYINRVMNDLLRMFPNKHSLLLFCSIVFALSESSKVENTSWKDFLFGTKWKSSLSTSSRDPRCM